MDAEAARQELQSYIQENFIHDREVKQSRIVSYLLSLDAKLEERTVLVLIKEMAVNGLFRLGKNEHGEDIILLPSH